MQAPVLELPFIYFFRKVENGQNRFDVANIYVAWSYCTSLAIHHPFTKVVSFKKLWRMSAEVSHSEILLNSTTHTQGLADQLPGPLMDSQSSAYMPVKQLGLNSLAVSHTLPLT